MTAQFLKQVNDLFDMLNVRGFGSKVAAPLKVDSHQQLCRMNELKEESQRWRVVGRPRPPCFEGLSQNVNAVLAMHADLVVDGPLSFLMTGRINQNPADNFFSQIRSKGGHRFNPSAKEFRFAFRNVSSTLILAPIPSANCTYDSDVMLSTVTRLSSNAWCSAAHPDEPDTKRPRLESAPMVLSADDFETPSAVTNVLSYIGGYLIKIPSILHVNLACALMNN